MTIVEISLEKNTWFEIYFCITVFITLAYAASNSLNLWIRKSTTRKKDGPTKYSRENNSDPRNALERKFRTHEYPPENFRPTKYPREKISEPQNTHERKFQSHKIPTTKNFGSTKYPREKILDPRNTHEKKFWTHEIPTKARCHDGTKPTRPTIARDPWNLHTPRKLFLTDLR